MVRILVVDDHTVVQSGLIMLLDAKQGPDLVKYAMKKGLLNFE
jgi:DNA-binding NarL/FixJ family response regulator